MSYRTSFDKGIFGNRSEGGQGKKFGVFTTAAFGRSRTIPMWLRFQLPLVMHRGADLLNSSPGIVFRPRSVSSFRTSSKASLLERFPIYLDVGLCLANLAQSRVNFSDRFDALRLEALWR